MPKRLFSDRAWQSDKLAAVQPDAFRAEYSWIYSLALADGTFECDPKKVWSQCYAGVRQTDGRGGWTVTRVAAMLDEFDKRGLLRRRTDEEGKQWGFWTGCDENLPPPGERHKYAQGKRFLFLNSLVTSESAASDSPENRKGVWFGLGLGLDIGKGVEVSAANDLSGLGADGDTAAVLDESSLGGLKPGVPGYFRRGQYTGTKPRDVWKHISRAWERARGEAAVSRYPGRFPGAKSSPWEDLCDLKSADLIVPAFELWAAAGANGYTDDFPASEFAKEAQKWLVKVLPLNKTKPAVSKEEEQRVLEAAAAANTAMWNTPVPAEEPEGDGSELFN